MAAREPIIIEERGKAPGRVRRTPDGAAAWRAVAWLGAALAIVGAVDATIALIPPSFGVPEWEFGAIASSLGSLPVLSIGLGALLGAFLARGQRRSVMSVATLLLVLGLIALGLYVVFLLTVPIALKGSPAPMLIAVKKTIAKASVLGIVFPIGYLVAAFSAFRSLRGAGERAA